MHSTSGHTPPEHTSSVRFTSQQRLDDGTVERAFTLGEITGLLWTPAPEPGDQASRSGNQPPEPGRQAPNSAPGPSPLILLGHPGGQDMMYPRLVGRAQAAAALGFAAVTIELPGSGQRPRLAALERARADLRRAIIAGQRPSEEIIEALILPLVDQAVPEWQATLDALLELPEIGGPVAISGGVIAIGIRLAVVEPRIVAAGLFAGSFVPRVMLNEARRVTIPLHMLLQWDDEGNDRQLALDLFDAFGSAEKTLQANMGGHTGVPSHAGEDAARFFARHLRPSPTVG